MRMRNRITKSASAALTFIACMAASALTVTALPPQDVGGGFAASGQISEAGYTAKIYDASNGLPTSDANYVLATSDGYIWIGGYSGIIRYDGNTFERLPDTDGLTNGRGLFEDADGRIWVGTNDNGVVVIDDNDRLHLTYRDGLPSSSIRGFAEDSEGNVFIGTTEGLCYCDPEMRIHVIADPRIKKERILRLDQDLGGNIYGQTKNGLIFRVENRYVAEVYNSSDLGMNTITTIKADPRRPGKVYLGTVGNEVFHGRFGDGADRMECIRVSPLGGIHWISYACNRIWVASIDKAGYIDDYGFHLLDNIPMDSGIEMVTSDYQGNIWFASSTEGVMKIVTDYFVDESANAGLPAEVSNAVCLYDGKLYVGTDNGLRIIDDGACAVDRLTDLIGNARVRCICKGNDDDLWIATYTNGLGVVHLAKDGEISTFNTENGMPDNEVRCICVEKDGTVLAGTNKGLAVIKNGQVTGCVGSDEGMENTVLLSVEEGDGGSIYAGTDGDGIYEIKGRDIRKIGRDDGLTSDVVARIKKDDKNGVYWIITSNSIQIMRGGNISRITTFPYNNNYDLYPDKNGNIWIISSIGVYSVGADELLSDNVAEVRLYTLENGLTGTPTSAGYGELDENGELYIPNRNGICRVNVDRFADRLPQIKADISSVTYGDETILPDSNGTYTLPSGGGRLTVNVAVLDYTLLNPLVEIYMEGKEDEGVRVARNDLVPLEYAGIEYGDYTLCVRVLDSVGKNVIVDEKYRIVKKAGFTEHPLVRGLLFAFVAFLAGFIVWRFLKNTVISSQYAEIRRARDEAERANMAKSRFLANMSHEIRTPINTIMGMNEMAMREDPTGVPKPYFMSMMNYAFDIRNASESLLTLINDLLDMSKIESGKMHLVEQEYDTQELLRSIVSMIRIRSTEKQLFFDVVVDEILPSRLFGDSGKIKQIILNLLTNAVKYTDVGGFSLSVSMEERQDNECKLRFSVNDTGIGIKEEDMDRLFKAYERLDEQKNYEVQGTGLGLDISGKFAELMGGTLTCHSTYGKGSEFVLELKQRIVDITPVGVFKEHDEAAGGKPYVPLFIAPDADILVVDDNPMNLNVIKGLLKGTRMFVSTAGSGEECLEKLKDTRFDVILLDHMMPGMDGVETMAEIRKDYPDLPVYALTANSAVGEEFYRSKGFNGYLSKPIDSHTLEATIMKHLPEEMMEKPAEQDGVEELTQIPETMQWIYETEGISVPDGIKNSGGISNYIFSLGLFADTIDGNAAMIRNSFESNNIKLYTIKVHSLKSSARIIGAMDLAHLAETLEEAGNREDHDYIAEYTPVLLADYEKFKEKLAGLHDDPGDDSREMIPEKDLKEAYRALCDVIPQMDYDAVEMILEQLGEYALPEEDDKKIRELAGMLRMFEWDKMAALMGIVTDGEEQ